MNIYQLIDLMEDELENSKKALFGPMRKVDPDQMLEILDEMRESLPEEVQEGEMIRREKDRILGEAQEDADHLAATSQKEADELLTNARRDSEQMLTSARNESEQMMARAQQDTERMISSAHQQAERIIQEDVYKRQV